MYKFLYISIVILRIIFGPLILIWPLLSLIVSFFLDLIDADFAHYYITKIQYQEMDKILDYWVYVFEMIYAWRFFPDFKIALIFLLAWRTIGMIAFYLTRKRELFMVFANHFENVFFLIFFANYFPNLKFLITNKAIFYTALTFLFVEKMILEWFIHVAKLSVREDFFKSKRKWKK